MAERFIKLNTLYRLLDLEPYILLACLVAIAWIFYKTFLREASEERHRIIRNHFRVLLRNFALLSLFFLSFIFLQKSEGTMWHLDRITPYVALITFVWGNVVFVKTSRLLVLQYMFLSSMKHGVPLLMVNMFSLILSIVLLFWGVTTIFGVDVGPLLATSAAFSIILGLALQDTLGNLFAGISLQLDKSYEIGDWLEVQLGLQKCVGQVKEITWRSTTLGGFSDELITLPNRFMSQAQISNFSPPEQPIVRRQIFKIAHGENIELAKQVIEQATAGIGEIRGIPSPYAYVEESNENWIAVKVIYFIDNYGSQFNIGDRVLRRGLAALQDKNIRLARQVIEIADHDESKQLRS
ncbi:MAG: mechanosensitive ion channel family protein [Bdellovibrionia bacterium]